MERNQWATLKYCTQSSCFDAWKKEYLAKIITLEIN
jgi:hypothetical protein